MITFRGQAKDDYISPDPPTLEILFGRVFVDGSYHTPVSVQLAERAQMALYVRGDNARAQTLSAARVAGLRTLRQLVRIGDFNGPAPESSEILQLMITASELDHLDLNSKPCEFRKGPANSAVCSAVKHQPDVTISWCLRCRVPETELLCMHASHVHIVQEDNPKACAIRVDPRSNCNRPPRGPDAEASVNPADCGGINSCWEVRLDSDIPLAESATISLSIEDLLSKPEDEVREFKRYANGTSGRPEEEEKRRAAIAKAICGFSNSRIGGTLLVGVYDDRTIHGIADDLRTINKSDGDGFEQWLRSAVRVRLSLPSLSEVQVRFYDQPGGTICRVDVPPASEPTFVVREDGNKVGKFYVRDGNGTKELLGPEQLTFIKTRFA